MSVMSANSPIKPSCRSKGHLLESDYTLCHSVIINRAPLKPRSQQPVVWRQIIRPLALFKPISFLKWTRLSSLIIRPLHGDSTFLS